MTTFKIAGTVVVNPERSFSQFAPVMELSGGKDVEVEIVPGITEGMVDFIAYNTQIMDGVPAGCTFSGDDKWELLWKMLRSVRADTREKAEAQLESMRADMEACAGFIAFVAFSREEAYGA